MNDSAFARFPNDIDGVQGEHRGEVGSRFAKPILVRFLRVAKRWKWLILGSVVVSVLIGLIATLFMTPLYTATATLEIQRESYRIVNEKGVEPEAGSVDLEFYQTQYGLLTSESLAERTAANMRLGQNIRFFEMFGDKKSVEQLRDKAAITRGAAGQRTMARRAGEILLKHINVKPARMSRLVDIEFTSPDAALSANVVNAWTKNFVETTLERRFEATSYARRFLEERLAEYRKRLQDTERALVAYAGQQGIINIPLSSSSNGNDPSTTTERPLVAENLAATDRELSEAIGERMKAQSRLPGNGANTTEALENQAISTLRQKRAELAAEYAKLLSQFEPQYPPAQALASQISQLDRSITREEARVSGTLAQTYRSAVARENALAQRGSQLKSDLLDMRNRSIQYNIYQREVDTNRQLYDGLLQRYKEIGVAGDVGVNNLSVVDPAQIPDRPSSPNLILNILLSLALGGILGCGLALALDQIDEAISDPREIEDELGVPLLGTVPKAEGDSIRDELNDRKSSVVEAYLSTQTSLAFSTDHGIPRSLTVTSTRPSEGKTTTSYALARSLGRTGKKVVLVDADMRSPSLHRIFGIENTAGTSNFLSGNGHLDELIRRDFADGVSVMTAGPLPPNAAELLTGDRLELLIRELVAKFDHVIFDVPPVMGLADAPLIASKVEGAIFVIESHGTRASMARVAIGRLKDANVRILGALMTKFESKRAHYGYGYDYGYGYGSNAKTEA